jgi:hypothetical protein
MRGAARVVLATLVGVIGLVGLTGCSTYRDQLARSQHAFEVNEHDRALALLRDLERDMASLSPTEQAQYCYLRGMTDYRIGYRTDARHWLALAKTYEESSPGVLAADWKARLTEALDEMNTVVYEEGLSALDKKPEGGRGKAKKGDAPKKRGTKGGKPADEKPADDSPADADPKAP